MRTERFPKLWLGVARLAGLTDTPPAESKAKIASFLTDRLDQGWTWDFWPEWTVCELRTYRDVWNNATAYVAPALNAPVEVYFPASQQYYQTVRASTNQPPASLLSGVYVTNTAYWQASGVSYSGPDWAAGVSQLVGDIVRNPSDGYWYGCFTAHTTVGTSMDLTKYGILALFERYVSLDQTGQTPIGEVKSVSWWNPRLGQRRPAFLPFKVTDRGIEPRNGAMQGAAGWYWPWTGGNAFGTGFIPSQVWVEFRKRAPQFSSTSWVNGGTYFKDDVVVNDGVNQDGECYKALVDSPGNTLSDTTKWEKQLCPKILANFVRRAAAADLLRPAGQHEKSRAEDTPAFEFLLQARDIAFDSQGQTEVATAETY